jgi:hypothetical protein
MKTITKTVLSLMALMMLTFGISYAKSSGGCCDGSDCCNASVCCHAADQK